MRTPQLWQKLKAGFKKPFQRLFQKRDHDPKLAEDNFFRDSGKSVYHQKKGERKKRKTRNRMANKSRAINYNKAK